MLVATTIHRSEEVLWSLISQEPERVCKGVWYYKPRKAFRALREASKFVIDAPFVPSELAAQIGRCKPSRVRVSPEFGRSLERSEIKEALRDTLFKPTGDSCHYLLADQHCMQHTIPEPFSIREVIRDNTADIESLIGLRAEKHASEEPPVRAALEEWTRERLQSIPGFRAVILCEGAVPCGYLCWFRTHDLTRMRDLFIKTSHRERGLSKYLLEKVMAENVAPFGVITNSHNPARRTYARRGLLPVFVQEAFDLFN